MKKGFFSSLILASCLFVTSLANAGGFNSVKFEQQYPHISQAVQIEIKGLALITQGSMLSTLHEEDVNKNSQQLFDNIDQCHAKLVNPVIFQIFQKNLQKELSKDELYKIETYFSSSAGQKDLAYQKQNAQNYKVKNWYSGQTTPEVSETNFIIQNGEDGRKMDAFHSSDLSKKYHIAMNDKENAQVTTAFKRMENCYDTLNTKLRAER